MTPKQLLEKHGGDPLAAADDHDGIMELNVPFKGTTIDLLPCPWPISGFVEATIAHLGEDGAEKCGKALAAIVVPNTLMLPVPVSAPNRLEPILSFTQVTRIANATDRERLAACIVALAEVEGWT